MKKKWIILTGVVVALGALVATAAAHRGGKMRGYGMRAVMQELDLSEEQMEQLQALRSAHRDKMKEARGEGREARRALHEEHIAEVSQILNDEQREQLEEFRAEYGDRFWAGKMHGHRGWGHGKRDGRGMWGGRGHGPRDAFAQLDLSDEQKEQLKGLRSAHREEVDKLRRGHREAVEKLLSSEQRAELEELKDEAFYGGKGRMRRPMW